MKNNRGNNKQTKFQPGPPAGPVHYHRSKRQNKHSLRQVRAPFIINSEWTGCKPGQSHSQIVLKIQRAGYNWCMKILMLVSGRQVPSSRFRVLQYVPYLESLGHRCTVAPSFPVKYRGLPLLGNRLSEIPRVMFRLWDWFRARGAGYDIVLVERELFSSAFSAIEPLFRKLVPTMALDIDDGIFLQHPHKFDKLARMADVVIVGNDLLAEKAQGLNEHVVVVPTAIDTGRYTVRESSSKNNPLTIGWTGTAGNWDSLQMLTDPLRALAEKHALRLKVIAEREPPPGLIDVPGMVIDFSPWQEETEISDLQSFDIGVMPLEDRRWNLYKCGFKIIQYMACGIPAIASPVGVNSQIIQHDCNGLLAANAKEWTECLSRLLQDIELRQRLATAGRKTVEERYSVTVNLPRLEAGLQAALTRGRA
jgi:glycosyltransferase involved in cell wall biosynthesis